jgi:hypothetical protein
VAQVTSPEPATLFAPEQPPASAPRRRSRGGATRAVAWVLFALGLLYFILPLWA